MTATALWRGGRTGVLWGGHFKRFYQSVAAAATRKPCDIMSYRDTSAARLYWCADKEILRVSHTFHVRDLFLAV